jgi:DNA invertase Pin-like site-specific DNA recombinase
MRRTSQTDPFRTFDSRADTGTGRLMIAVLGGLADVERSLIRTLAAEGRSRAKAQGKHMACSFPYTGPTEGGH